MKKKIKLNVSLSLLMTKPTRKRPISMIFKPIFRILIIILTFMIIINLSLGDKFFNFPRDTSCMQNVLEHCYYFFSDFQLVFRSNVTDDAGRRELSLLQ